MKSAANEVMNAEVSQIIYRLSCLSPLTLRNTFYSYGSVTGPLLFANFFQPDPETDGDALPAMPGSEDSEEGKR